MTNDTDQTEASQPDWCRLLTAAERAAMLHDIARVSLAAGARLFPDQPWSDLDVSGGHETAHKSPVERLGFIEYLLPVLAQALIQIAHSPLTSAAAHTRAALPHRARRVTASAWMAYARRGQSSRALDETVTLLSVNTPENRALKSFLAVLERDSSAIAQIAGAERRSGSRRPGGTLCQPSASNAIRVVVGKSHAEKRRLDSSTDTAGYPTA